MLLNRFVALIDDDKSHYVYIKDFNRCFFHKTKNKNKKYFCKSCLQCFSCGNVLTELKRDCLRINGVQAVKSEKGTVKFKKIFKQIPSPFKICPDFECNLKSGEAYEACYPKKYHFPCSFVYKVVCIDNRFSKAIAVFKGKYAAYDFIKEILKEYEYCRKIIKRYFNKNLIMSEEEEKQFQLSNACWICKKLIDDDDEKVRDHCHVTGKL